MITSDGPDMGTSCGSPANILSVGATYVRGIGATCGDYRAWAPYSRIPTKARQALTDGCSSGMSFVISFNYAHTCVYVCKCVYNTSYTLLATWPLGGV